MAAAKSPRLSARYETPNVCVVCVFRNVYGESLAIARKCGAENQSSKTKKKPKKNKQTAKTTKFLSVIKRINEQSGVTRDRLLSRMYRPVRRQLAAATGLVVVCVFWVVCILEGDLQYILFLFSIFAVQTVLDQFPSGQRRFWRRPNRSEYIAERIPIPTGAIAPPPDSRRHDRNECPRCIAGQHSISETS